MARSLLSAGVDTTVSGLGGAVYCLARFPEQFTRLHADRSLACGAVEEALRYESRVQTSSHWERPDDYDIARRIIGHVGFGSGIHHCVGQLLARLEGECVLSALARKVTSIEITGPIRRRYNNTLHALANLPVALQAA